MTNTINPEFQRSKIQSGILNNMGGNAPAFGMVGTLIGLVVMLDNLGPNPEQIGSCLGGCAFDDALRGFGRSFDLSACRKNTSGRWY